MLRRPQMNKFDANVLTYKLPLIARIILIHFSKFICKQVVNLKYLYTIY